MVLITAPVPESGIPEEDIIMQMPSTKLFVNDQEVGTATLYINKQSVIWRGGVKPDGGPTSTITLDYQRISMHGVQRVPNAFLFLMLDYELSLPELNAPQQQGGEGDMEDSDSEEEFKETQLKFVPPNENELTALYTAMTEGQSLNPDPKDEYSQMDEDDEEEEFHDGEEFEDAEESEATPEDAANDLSQLHIKQPNGNHHADQSPES